MQNSSADQGRRISGGRCECGCIVASRRSSQTSGAPIRSLYDRRQGASVALVVSHAPARLPGIAGFDFREG